MTLCRHAEVISIIYKHWPDTWSHYTDCWIV